MFGLTRREQRWKAEEKAATLLVGLATAAIEANAKIAVAEAQNNGEVEALRNELAEAHATINDLRKELAARVDYDALAAQGWIVQECKVCGTSASAYVKPNSDDGK